MTEIEWWDYDDADEMAEAVAGDAAFVIESALDARGQAVIALPGGKTPLPIYQKLADKQLDWKRVTIIHTEIRRASWRERVCQYGYVSGVDADVKTKNRKKKVD